MKHRMRLWDAGRERAAALFLIAIGLAGTVGLAAYANVHFPLTNYNSRIGVDSPTVYYVHDLRGGDTLYLSIDVVGEPTEILVLDGDSFQTFQQNRSSSSTLPTYARVSQALGRIELRFSVPDTERYYVVFAADCSTGCAATSVQARLWVTEGQVSGVPVPWAIAAAISATALGVVLLLAQRRRQRATPERLSGTPN